MKIFGKKNNRPGQRDSKTPPPPDSGAGFYEQRDAETPLDGTNEGAGTRVHRTSRHTPPRRRETSNRASHRQLTALVLKIFLIPILLMAGYFVLKLAVSRLEAPSEKDEEKWETSAEVMERGTVSAEALPEAEVVEMEFSDEEPLKQLLDRLEQADYLLRSAEALEQRGMDEEAAARFQEALQFAPENLVIRKSLLELRIKLGNYEEALPLCVRLLEQDSRDQEVREHLLTALHETGQSEASLFLAEQMLEKTPGNLHVMEVAAYDYAAKGEPDKALEMYDGILQRDPGHLLALEGSATIYEWQGEWIRALPYRMKLVRLDPQDERYRALARNYAQQNEAGKAVIFLGQASSLYGEAVVIPWLSDPRFDPVRKTVEFRSFADQVVGAQTREMIEELRRREIQQPGLMDPLNLDRPAETDLEILKPRQR
jgi:tetratricopeptide (TPR) repeat protein